MSIIDAVMYRAERNHATETVENSTMTRERLGRILDAGANPVGAASLALFRIAFGIAMIINVSIYLVHSLVYEYYVNTTFTFPYAPLDFVQPLPGYGVHAVYFATIIVGALIAVGLWYRVAITVFLALHLYVFLIDSTNFQNHEYLIALIAFLMIFLPAHRMWSLDAHRNPDLARETVPAWTIWLLRFQIGVPYFYGGLAKINHDWLRGEPLGMWLASPPRSEIQVVGPLLSNELVVAVMNYGSLVFDLAIVWLLLYHRTRVLAFVFAVGFHLLNALLWGLFIFPWLMIAATTVFFAPDWPLTVRDWWNSKFGVEPSPRSARSVSGGLQPRGLERMKPVLVTLLAVWVLLQLLVPFRHFLIDGNVSWTEEGHRFAWHMMLRSKQGTVTYYVTPQDGETFAVDPREYLNEKQATRLAGYPERLLRFAHHLSAMHDGAEVRAETAVRFNGREPVPIVDPGHDLTQEPLFWIGSADWILPNEEPLRRD